MHQKSKLLDLKEEIIILEKGIQDYKEQIEYLNDQKPMDDAEISRLKDQIIALDRDNAAKS